MRPLPLVAALTLTLAAQAAPLPKQANPLLQTWSTPFGLPPFDQIKAEHYLPAYQAAFKAQKAELKAITTTKAKPTFANTIEKLETSGALLSKVRCVFDNLVGAESNAQLDALNAQISPLLTAHMDDIYLDAALFKRVKAVYDTRETLTLTPEQAKSLTRIYRKFVRGGANLDLKAKKSFREINGKLSSLEVQFSQNLLAETNAARIVVIRGQDLEGVTRAQLTAAMEEGRKSGKPGHWVFTAKTPSFLPFMETAENRTLRQQLLESFASRGNQGNDKDNKAVYQQIVTLRADKAKLLGFDTFTTFVLDDTMAQNSGNAYGLLKQLWTASLDVVKKDRSDLQAMAGATKLEPWDWRFYEGKVRKAKYDFDTEALRPYFPLEKVRDGAFAVAKKLYGLSFTELKDVPVYHTEVKAFEVKEADGTHVGVFYTDWHPRPGKRGGAWQSNYRETCSEKGKPVTPVVVNVCNFTRPSGDAPALLSLDEVETLWHEFGHALHALLMKANYRGTASFPADFVELPSQIMENWAMEPAVLKEYAKHWKTGEAIPDALLAKMEKAGKFGQGFATYEYLSAALLDLEWHQLKAGEAAPDVNAFEKAFAEKWGAVPEILPRYRTTYFAHSAGSEYASAYYSYIWAAVLDTDAFQAFKEAGDLYSPEKAKAFRTLLEESGSKPPAELYRNFRGRDPKVDALLDKRGLK